MLEQAALEIALELCLNIARQWLLLGDTPIPKPRIVLGHELVEQRRLRPVTPVARRRDEAFGLREVRRRHEHRLHPCTTVIPVSVAASGR